MNKAELVAAVAEKAEVSKKDAETILEAFISTVADTLANDEKVQINGFGTFETRQRAERIGRNPRTGEEMKIPATVVPTFKPGKQFKVSITK